MPPLPPKWLFGYIQSKYGYFSSKQTLDIAKKFNELGLPATGIVLDLYWFKHMGDIDWHEDNFPDPLSFIKELDTLGFKLINISEPFFDSNSKNFKSFQNAGYFGKDSSGKMAHLVNWWGKGGVFDYSNPAACNALWSKSYRPQLKQGVAGLWTDLGEPEGVYYATRFKEGREDEIHNIYNLLWSKMLYNNISKEFPNVRPVILSRSGWSGSPKYGVSIWSGDAKSDWGGLKIQPFIMMSSNLSGFSYWASDVGGFVGEGTPDLFIRWNEFGLFSPIYRPHGSGVDREPWAYEEDALTYVSKLVKLRSRFLPYIYSSAYQTSSNGTPMITPVNIYDKNLSDEKRVEFENNQYYFGKSIFYRQPYENESYEVYLPEKGDWIDMSTYKIYQGEKVHNIKYIKGEPSYFLKPASIFVMNRDESYKKNENLDIYINSTGSGVDSFVVYNDDGITNSFKNGSYSLLNIKNSVTTDKTVIEIIPEKSDYKDERPNLNFKIFINKNQIKNSTIEGKIDTNDGSFNFMIGYPDKKESVIIEY